MTETERPPVYPRTPCWPWSPSTPRGDRTTTTPGDFLGREIVVTEKLDGASTALYQGQALDRSGSTKAPWLGMARRNHAWKVQEQGLVIYGEDLYAVHSINYNPMKTAETFRMFALMRDDTFAAWDEVTATAAELDIPTVPILWQGTATNLQDLMNILENLHQQQSALGPDMEGLVIRSREKFARRRFRRNVCKSVRANHVQQEQHWRRNWIPARMLPE